MLRVSEANSEWFWHLWTGPTTRLPGEPFALPPGVPLRAQEHFVREPSPVDSNDYGIPDEWRVADDITHRNVNVGPVSFHRQEPPP